MILTESTEEWDKRLSEIEVVHDAQVMPSIETMVVTSPGEEGVGEVACPREVVDEGTIPAFLASSSFWQAPQCSKCRRRRSAARRSSFDCRLPRQNLANQLSPRFSPPCSLSLLLSPFSFSPSLSAMRNPPSCASTAFTSSTTTSTLFVTLEDDRAREVSTEKVIVWRRKEIERFRIAERGARSEVMVSTHDGQWRLLIRSETVGRWSGSSGDISSFGNQCRE